MLRPIQESSPEAGPKWRIGILGGDRLGLEMLALLYEDPQVQVVGLWEPQASALIFRLETLGYRFAPGLRPKVVNGEDELATLHPDFVVDTTERTQLRPPLSGWLSPGVWLIPGQIARRLWEIRLGKREVCGEDAEVLESFLGDIDSYRPGSGLVEILLLLGLLFARGHGGELYLAPPAQSLSLALGVVLSPSGLERFSSPMVSPVLEEVVRSGRSLILPEAFRGVSGAPGEQVAPEHGAEARPVLVLPLAEGGKEAVGALQLFKAGSAAPFSSGAIQALSLLCASALGPLRRLLQRRQVQETSLVEGLRAEAKGFLHSDLALPDKLAKGLEHFCEALGGGWGHIYLKDGSSEDLVLEASTLYPAHFYGLVKIREGDGIVGEAAQRRQSVFLKNAGLEDPNRPRASFYIPLKAPAVLAGVLCLEQVPVEIRPEKLLDILEDLGEEFARGILRDLEQQRMAQKLLKLSVVQEKGLEMLSVVDEERLRTLIAASAALLVEAEAAVLRFYEKEEKSLPVRSTFGVHHSETDSRLMELDSMVALKTFQSGASQVLEDLAKTDPALPPRFPYRYGICVPLHREDELVGTLSLYNKMAYSSFGCTAFSQDDVEILKKFSHYISKALVNLQQARQHAELMAIDELTGLRNERYFMLRLPEEIRRAERHQRTLSLAVIEVVRETGAGPLNGLPPEEDLIRQIAEVLQETFRNVDILVRGRDARFMALMPDTGKAVGDVLARLIRALTAFPVRVFIGHSIYPVTAKTAQEMISKASQVSEVVRQA